MVNGYYIKIKLCVNLVINTFKLHNDCIHKIVLGDGLHIKIYLHSTYVSRMITVSSYYFLLNL